MKKLPNWIYILGGIILIIVSKFIFFAPKNNKNVNIKGKQHEPLTVNYIILKHDTLKEDVYSTGKIGAINQISILPEINGKIISVNFKEGETVSKGSLLVKLNDQELQAQLLKANTQISLSENKLNRLKKLIQINGVSKEDVEIQENELNSLKADKEFILAQIAKTNIVAPFNGVIGLKNVSEGSFVSTNTPIASLVQLNPLFIEFSVSEKYSTLLTKLLPVTFNSEINKEKQIAKIYAIEPKIDELTKTIKVRALINDKTQYYPGSFVKVYLSIGEINDALLIPTQCVIPTLKGQKVFISKNKIATEVDVVVGDRTDSKIQIISGLNVGDTIITTGLLMVKNGAELNLIKSN